MGRNAIVPPPQQQMFEFARTDLWRRLPAAAQEECMRLIMQQLKQSLEFEHRESQDEREDSR